LVRKRRKRKKRLQAKYDLEKIRKKTQGEVGREKNSTKRQGKKAQKKESLSRRGSFSEKKGTDKTATEEEKCFTKKRQAGTSGGWKEKEGKSEPRPRGGSNALKEPGALF